MGNFNSSFDPDTVFQSNIDIMPAKPSITTTVDVFLDIVDPITRTSDEKNLRKILSIIPGVNQLETLEHAGEIQVARQLEQHQMHKQDFQKIFPTASNHVIDAMAAVTNNAIEPLAAAIIIKTK